MFIQNVLERYKFLDRADPKRVCTTKAKETENRNSKHEGTRKNRGKAEDSKDNG